MLKRRLLLSCALGVLLIGPAMAVGPTTISKTTKTAQTTSADGDITINKGGSVTITVAGPAVKIDSSNTVTNSGLISNKNTTNAIGVELLGGNTGSYQSTTTGVIDLTGKGTDKIAILVDGAGSFIGNIILERGSTVTVEGDNSTGIKISSPLIGNVILNTQMKVTGTGATGLLVTAPITGEFINDLQIKVSGTAKLSTKSVNPQSGSAVAIGADISAGMFNNGPASSTATGTLQGALESQGAIPTLVVSPTVAGAGAANLTIGIFDDPDNINEGFSFLNRGIIKSEGNDPGVNANAVLIGGNATYTTTLTDGIFTRGNILATANSGTGTQIPAPTNATAIEIGNKAIIGSTAQGILNGITNFGAITATTSGLGGGTATALVVDAGGSLTTINNGGTISATATLTKPKGSTATTLNAYAIRYLSSAVGTVTINNLDSGTITATATTLDGGGQITVAADFSSSSSRFIFNNAGMVTGDILFGSGADELNSTGGTITAGTIAFGTGANLLSITGGGLVSGTITNGGTLGITVTSGTLSTNSAPATSLAVGATGTVNFVLGNSAPVAGTGIITTTGNASFANGSTITLGFDGVPGIAGTPVDYTLVHSTSGTVTVTNLATLAVTMPWLYTGSVSNPDAQNIVLHFTRKAVDDPSLNFTGNTAAIFEPALAAAANDSQFAGALLAFPNTVAGIAEGKAALDQLVPDVSGDVRTMAIALTDQATGAIGARQRVLTEYAGAKSTVDLWGQEFFHNLSFDGNAAGPGYEGSGFGFTLGGDGGTADIGRYGASFTFFSGSVRENRPRDTKTLMQWYMLSLYSNWRGHVLFFNTQANAAWGDMTGSRKIEVGSLVRSPLGAWADYLASAGFSTGLMLNYGGFSFMPQWNVDGLYIRNGGYTEHGGGKGVDLSLTQYNDESVRSFLGFIMRGNIGLGDGFIQPEIRGGWSYEFRNDPEQINAVFASAPSLPFRVTGPTADPSKLLGGISLALAYESWSLNFDYDATFAGGFLSHAGMLTLTGHI